MRSLERACGRARPGGWRPRGRCRAGRSRTPRRPSAAGRSISRTHSRSVSANSTRTPSPTGWPKRSLIDLKLSRSASTNATEPPKRSARISSLASASSQWRRLARPGEHVDEGLAGDDPVQPCVLERDRRVCDERRRGAPLLHREAAAREGERAEALPACRERELEALAPVGERSRLDDLACEPDDEPAGGAGRLDHGLDDHAQQLVDVMRRGQRLAEADIGVAQPRSLGAELLDPRLELVGHLVEGQAEPRELVAAPDPTRRSSRPRAIAFAASARPLSDATIELPTT